MSTEVVKKRGRPRKVVTEPLVEEISEVAPKLTATRAKSTKVASSKSTTKSATKSKTATTKVTAEDAAVATSKTSSKSTSSAKKTLKTTNGSKVTKAAQIPPATPETSQILKEVKELSAKRASAIEEPPSSAPSPSASSAISNAPPIATESPSSSSSVPSNTPPTPPSVAPTTKASNPPADLPRQPPPISHATPPPPPAEKAPPPPPPQAKPSLPIKGLNAAVVSDISRRAGGRPNPSGPQKSLPPNYKPVARRVTMTIVALPIAIVTSYVLYQRCESTSSQSTQGTLKPELTGKQWS